MSLDTEVYVVDDDSAVRDSLRSLLELEGFKVSVFASGAAFLQSLDPSATGVLLLDVRLPDINGLDVQRRLVTAGSALKIVIITGHGDVPMAVKAMQAGAADFIEKPFKGGIVVDSVRHALADDPPSLSLPLSADDEVVARIETLTRREMEVLEHLVVGRQNKVIARELGISPRTVENHRAHVMEKMEAHSLSHLIRMALSAGIDPPAD